MAEKYGISEAQYKLIQQQASRRVELRREFLKQRTNPWKHAAEAGYVVSIELRNFLKQNIVLNSYNSTKNVCFVLV